MSVDEASSGSDEDDLFACHSDRKALAKESLGLFTSAIAVRAPCLTQHFPVMFDFRLWGSILGMFSLNNLSVYVQSPLPRWATQVQSYNDNRIWEELNIPGKGKEQGLFDLILILT